MARWPWGYDFIAFGRMGVTRCPWGYDFGLDGRGDLVKREFANLGGGLRAV